MEQYKDRLIFNSNDNTYCILDNNNKFIINTTGIDFSNLPTNIFDNVELFLGNEYQLYNFDYQEIVSLLINDNITFNKLNDNYFRDKNDNWLYDYNEKTGTLDISFTRITSILETKYGFNYYINKQLCKGILEAHYKWKVVTTNLL